MCCGQATARKKLCSTAIRIVDRLLFVRPIAGDDNIVIAACYQPLAPKDGKPPPVPYCSFPELGADIVPEQMISKMIFIACDHLTAWPLP